ncbi:hypothetical protein GH733_001609 [Mirounga leonina]|nr:hypothetical protein GH733_001609 [Mirounga leonina]
MGRPTVLLLLLAFLTPGAAIRVPPAMKALSSLRWSTSFTSRGTVAKKYSIHYIEQKVNHFGFDADKTFKQRYLIADEQWKKNGGSILFYTGNEGDITWFCNNTDSRHLDFLTSEQALADFAVLIKHLKKTIPGAKNQPVIAIGGSYGGMLAAWFRMKYPHIVVGALAASAPIWHFGNLVPCGVFMEIVTKDFKRSGPNCSETIRSSWDAINRFARTGAGLRWLSENLDLCTALTNIQDVQHLKAWISETWINLAMVDYPYESDFLQPLPAWPIKTQASKKPSLSPPGRSSHTNPVVTAFLNGNFSLCLSDRSNGELDPWSGGGVTKDITDTLVAITIPEGAHHLDLRARNAFDPTTVLLARSLEVRHMKQWIRDFYANQRKKH